MQLTQFLCLLAGQTERGYPQPTVFRYVESGSVKLIRSTRQRRIDALLRAHFPTIVAPPPPSPSPSPPPSPSPASPPSPSPSSPPSCSTSQSGWSFGPRHCE